MNTRRSSFRPRRRAGRPRLRRLRPDSGRARAGAARRREVVVNGKRVKTVDVHAHCAVPEALGPDE